MLYNFLVDALHSGQYRPAHLSARITLNVHLGARNRQLLPACT